jgi:type II secretory pathway predicted ATPase ExeA
MIRAHFGLASDPFSAENITLLPHQQQVLDIVRVHCQQGGFCLIMGEPGTGKSVLKRALCEDDSKRLITPVVKPHPAHLPFHAPHPVRGLSDRA